MNNIKKVMNDLEKEGIASTLTVEADGEGGWTVYLTSDESDVLLDRNGNYELRTYDDSFDSAIAQLEALCQ